MLVVGGLAGRVEGDEVAQAPGFPPAVEKTSRRRRGTAFSLLNLFSPLDLDIIHKQQPLKTQTSTETERLLLAATASGREIQMSAGFLPNICQTCDRSRTPGSVLLRGEKRREEGMSSHEFLMPTESHFSQAGRGRNKAVNPFRALL